MRDVSLNLRVELNPFQWQILFDRLKLNKGYGGSVFAIFGPLALLVSW